MVRGDIIIANLGTVIRNSFVVTKFLSCFYMELPHMYMGAMWNERKFLT